MTDPEIEKKVKSAFTSNVPNVLDQILSECGKQEGREIVMPERKIKNRRLTWIAGIAAVFVLLITGILGTRFYQINYGVDSVVSLDVNPSIEIRTNQNEKVINVLARNEDAQIVIGEMNFKGSDLEVTVNALIGSMLRNGYLNDSSNSILISVYGDNGTKADALQEKLSQKVQEILQTDTFCGAILSQVVSQNPELQTLADAYGISLGKAQLIQQFIRQNPQYSFENLAALTINELNLMRKINGISLDDVQSVGDVSGKAYIGVERVKEIVFSQAEISDESAVSKLKIEMDYEHGIMIYEVSFFYENNKYHFGLDAITGEATEFRCDPVEDKEGTNDEKDKSDFDNTDVKNPEKPEKADAEVGANPPADYIGEDAAKEIALSRAALHEADIANYCCEMSIQKELPVYKIKFVANGYNYSCDVNAMTGEIVKFDMQPVHLRSFLLCIPEI